jgi:uncharacterized membrane protein HdeD (DUF308 family)
VSTPMTDRLRAGAGAGRWPAGDRHVTSFFVGPVSDEDLRNARRWLLGTGILSLLAGLLALAIPAAASVAVAILLGWVLLFGGVVMLAHALRVHAPHRVGRILHGALTALAGLCLLVFPLTGTFTLTFILAVWFYAMGALMLLVAWMQRGLPGAGMTAFNGILSLALGILLVADLPSSAGWAIGLLVGINLIFWGVRAIVAERLLRRALPRA